MNKRQLEVERAKVKEEQKELRHLKAIYNKALEDITGKIRLQDGKINVLMKDFDSLDEETKSILQSQIYQKKFQQSLKKQLDGYMSSLLAAEYKSIDDYMRKSYETGYVGNLYDLHGQNVPVLLPIDEKLVVKAMFTESKLSKKLYKRLGEDVELLKKRVANNLSRGVATSDSWANIARNIANDSRAGVNRAMRIARTEGHRIQCEAAYDAMVKAKEKGADIVKQWDATLDGRTRKTHRLLDGQVREVDEPFEVKGKKVMYPGKFGRPEEDINCRCAAMSRVRSKMNEEELETLKKRAEYHGLDKTKDFEDFRKRFLKAEKSLEKSGKSGTIETKWDNDLEPRGQAPHIDEDNLYNFVANELEISEQEAVEYVDAVMAYTDAGSDIYAEIRRYQRGEQLEFLEGSVAKEISDYIEEYIQKAPRWNGGETFRGCSMSDELVEEVLIVGKSMDMRGVASWSGTESVAIDFAEKNLSYKDSNVVIFHCETQSKGTGIRHISIFEEEDEILCSKDSEYLIDRVEKNNDQVIHVYLEEV